MALFQKAVLNKYKKLQEQEVILKAYKKFSKYFHNTTIQENIKSSKEEEYQGIFLTELFVNVLGYELSPKPNYNLVAEYKNQNNSRKADGAILKDDIALGVIELKGTKTKDLESITRQAFDYKANQKGCVYIITSNFEKLRFYINDATDFEEFNLFTLTQEQFELLYICLNKTSIFSNLPLKIKEESLNEEEQITKKFYKDYSDFKRELYRDLVKLNGKQLKTLRQTEINSDVTDEQAQKELLQLEKNVKLSLFKKSQKLIDRFLFIFFAEDRGLLPPNSTKQILDNWNKLKELDAIVPLYDRFKLYFNYLDTGRAGTNQKAEIFAYNGGLFKPDNILDGILISDELLFKHTLKLANYDFESQVDVNILGHIFENSLNEIESVNAEIEGGDFDKQKSKRKKDGVFYTPKYITKYIVENTVGKLCEEKKNELGFKEEEYYKSRKGRQQATLEKLINILDEYREWLLQLTICDPACGSGAFLNQALDFLIKEHTYIDELKTKLLGGGLVLSDIENTILENNIFGVDLNEESVEIAKLSLWLRTAQPRRKLNDLSSNVKCGNSLIESKTVAGDKAFNWQEQFPQVFAKGGFDVIIGNPPYVSVKMLSTIHKDYYINKYISATGQFDLYILFYEKGSKILKEKGVLSYITSNTFISNKDYLEFRKFILLSTDIYEILNLGETVFEDANLDVAILSFQNQTKENSIINICKNRQEFDNKSFSKVNSKTFIEDNYEIKINISSSDLIIIKKINKGKIPLSEILELPRGIEFGSNSDKIFNEYKEGSHKIIFGRNINRYSILFDNTFCFFEKNISVFKDYAIYENEKILIQRIRNLSLKRRIVATYDNSKILCTNTLRIGNLKNKDFNLKYILALLNSKVINFIFLKQFLNKDIYAFQLQQIPILKIANEKQQPIIEKVDIMISSNKVYENTINKFQSYFQQKFQLEKLTKKLEHWYELSFGEFIKEVNKLITKENKERAKQSITLVEVLTKKDEFEWMELFEENKVKANDLKAQIDKTDREIDKMVYALYELTDEEIKIVEES